MSDAAWSSSIEDWLQMLLFMVDASPAPRASVEEFLAQWWGHGGVVYWRGRLQYRALGYVGQHQFGFAVFKPPHSP